ncbi:DUF7507 domain-containing protein [Clostridium felsineum]|uniref:DUF7507 domain-containing protein n=1 Tax=Clostridium felsineum TaxID=36839 RepID=UPI00098C72C2|nr:DUF11 domain-containing protein [Clostridium felsineum]URZ17985.1 hypothetical protein CLFE_040400 [Clostridium felsineum DSM 794]
MALIGRFSTIDKAIITTTGNSLVICGDTTAPTINTSYMITPDGGVTRDYSLSGSSAKINILSGSTILYAELTWFSTVKSSANGAIDVRSIQDNPITLVTPTGSVSVNPDFSSSYTNPTSDTDRLRSADITSIVKTSLGGTYTVKNIPTSIPPTGLSEVKAGWTLTLIYRHDSFKPKRIVYALGIEAATQAIPIQASFTGFTTEANEETLKGDLIIVTANGNPLDGNDILKIGPSFAKLTTIGNPIGTPNPNPGTAPNNPWNSFSSGQINIADTLNSNKGLIDISGTKGTSNHDAFVPTQVLGARNKWDITCVDISNTLVANQTQLAGQYTLSNSTSALELIGIASQIDSSAPNIVATLNAYDVDGDNEYSINVNERAVYIVKITNSGKTTAQNVTLSTNLDSSLQFVPNSITINGVTQTGANITTGINIGNIEPSGVTNVAFTIKAVSLTQNGSTANTTVNYNYAFTSGASSPTYINYANTNSLSLIIQDGSLNVVKSVSSPTAKLGDTLVYTNTITNTGSEKAFNILFQDKINKYCSFIPNSVKIDGVSYSDYNPNTGFSISDLASKAQTIITFSVKVNSLSPNTVIDNGSLVSFSYIFNQYAVPVTKTILSNSTSIQTQFYNVVAKRTADNYYPNVGDTVTYTLSLVNIGNISATNFQVIEPPVNGTSFVDGSVYVNKVRKLGANPFTGFSIDDISAQDTTTVTYQVIINEIQPNQIIENIAKIPFNYQISSSTPVISSEKDSNKVTTRTNFVTMAISETVDKPYATLNDILYYSVNITNTGNIDAINTTFLSSIQSESTFIPNTVAINGLIQTGFNPNLGFSLGTISPGNTINVTFQTKVDSVPNPNIIYNSSNLVYSYKPDPNGNPLTNTITSNQVQTVINTASFTFTKTVDKKYAVLGDFLVYKCTLLNTGTVDLNNVKFNDEISAYLSFLTGSVYVDGINYLDYNPNTSFNIGTVKPNQSVEILFGTQVKTAPPFGYVVNMGDISYNYKVNPDSPTISESKKSNAVQTKIIDGRLSLTKVASLSYAAVGDTITYSLEISNTGNVPVNNVFFFDSLQSEAAFVSGSVTVNGINKSDYNPVTGFSLGSLNVGQVIDINFNVTVSKLPSPNTIINSGSASYSYTIDPANQPVSKTSNSNSVTTVINKGSATLTKTVDKKYATVDDTLTYTITANNTGTVPLTKILFKDLIGSSASFVTGSVVIDNVNYPSYDPNTGFNIPDIISAGTSVISFKVIVTTIPNPNQLNNTASMTYTYKINPSGYEYSDSSTSNTVTTYLNQVVITNTKSVDKLYAEVSNTLTYTSVIKNTGNVDATNTNFIDSLASELSFTSGSVTINGTPFTNYDPTTGFTLGTITPNSTITVVFKVTVDSLPYQGHVHNSSTIYYNYKIDPTSPDILAYSNSNTVDTTITSGTLTVNKTANREYARLTDTITYNFVVTNTGNTTLSNLLFQDAIQVESSFNAGSVYVNGTNKSNYNPNTGFSLDNLPVGSFATISFTVTVNSLPGDGKLYNTGNVNYSYFVDPSKAALTKNITSNKTTVNINNAIVSSNKTVDKSIAKIGDTLNYSVTITNAGNVPAKFVQFTDPIDTNTTFNEGTVSINGQSKPTFNPNDGFSLDDIGANSSTTVNFSVTIAKRPSDNLVKNYATIEYSYRVNPADPYINVSINTNRTTTYVAYGELTLTKAVNKSYASVLDTLTYTINITNSGSVNATNLIFKDPNPTSAAFVPGTIVVDGVKQSNFDPNTGFSLSDLIPNGTHTVSFDVLVNSLPASGKVDNIANTSFSYKLTVTDPTATSTAYSNTVTTYINLGKLTLTKAVDKAYATINDTLLYTIVVKNEGNVTCSNISLQDIIQSDAAFVAGSVTINDTAKPNLNPNTGFNLGDIAKGASTTVTFNVTVKSLPTNYYIRNNASTNYSYLVDPTKTALSSSSTSNTVTTQINVGMLSVTKQTSKTYATLDDIITYTTTIINTGNTNTEYINFRDVIPSGLTFVTDSVQINGIIKPGLNPYQSFTLGTILPGDTVIVKFNTKITSLPSPNIVKNIANIVFSYKIDPTKDYIVTEKDSNSVTTQINVGNLTLTKTVDKAYAQINDTLVYTIKVANTGNVDVQNVLFTDPLPSAASFVTGSVTIDGTTQPDYDPTSGFNLGTIATLSSITISFKVTVNSLPEEYTIINLATSTYSYKIDPNDGLYTKSTNSNSVSTIIVYANLSSLAVVNLAYATIGDTLSYTINLKNTGNTTVSSLYFLNNLSQGATFTPGTVAIDGVINTNLNPITGFSLPDIISGHTTVITFNTKATTLTTPPIVTDYATFNGVYKVDPNGIDYQVSTTSNTVSTQINVGNLTNIKAVDTMYAKVYDTLTYTNTITNVGNITALNTWFFDNLQAEAQFIAGTVSINNVVYPALNPVNGFTLGDLTVGTVVTVSFEVKITALPVTAQIVNNSNTTFNYKIDPSGNSTTKTISSNNVITNVVKGEITSTKTVDKSIATIGDILTYTINLTNTGNVIASNLLFQDTPSNGASFNTGSVIVNGTQEPTFDPTKGFTLSSLGIGNVTTIQFTATVNAVPDSNKITNQAITTFKFLVDPKGSPVNGSSYSNTTTTNVALGNLTVTKAVDKNFATIGDTLTYTIVIKNTGNIDTSNVEFLDYTPKNTTFIINSVTVNGVSKPGLNPSVGFDLGTMNPGQIITVIYKVTVD